MTAPCSSPGCPKPSSSRGLCVGHYARLRAGRSIDTPLGRTGPAPGEPTEQVATNLPVRLKRELERRATIEGLSLYALLRRVVEEWLATHR